MRTWTHNYGWLMVHFAICGWFARECNEEDTFWKRTNRWENRRIMGDVTNHVVVNPQPFDDRSPSQLEAHASGVTEHEEGALAVEIQEPKKKELSHVARLEKRRDKPSQILTNGWDFICLPLEVHYGVHHMHLIVRRIAMRIALPKMGLENSARFSGVYSHSHRGASP